LFEVIQNKKEEKFTNVISYDAHICTQCTDSYTLIRHN